jgi:hypothetical protein
LIANALRPGAWDLDSGWTSGVTPTIVGELFLNFWWPGVGLGGLLIGFLAGRLYLRFVQRSTGPWDAIKYSLLAVFVFIAGTLGEFYGTLIAFAVYALPVFLAARIARAGRTHRVWEPAGALHGRGVNK